jgi:predicted DNA-binding transcriptional regulator YafY
MIHRALQEGRPLRIVYLKPSGEKTRRVVWPLELGEVEYRGRQFLGLRAFCGHRQGERVFRVDRILEMELGGTGAFRSRTTAASVVSGGGFRTPPPMCSQPSPVTFQ